jgi:hypothetical protein
VLDIKTLIKIFKEAVDKLLIPVGDLDFKDTIIPNEPLTDNGGGLFNFIAFKPNKFEINTLNISVDYN